MKQAEQIIVRRASRIMETIREALQAGRPAYLTDGTVTRAILAAEIDGYVTGEFLTIGTETGTAQFEVSLGGYLEGDYGLVELSDGIYFAPDWWIRI